MAKRSKSKRSDDRFLSSLAEIAREEARLVKARARVLAEEESKPSSKTPNKAGPQGRSKG